MHRLTHFVFMCPALFQTFSITGKFTTPNDNQRHHKCQSEYQQLQQYYPQQCKYHPNTKFSIQCDRQQSSASAPFPTAAATTTANVTVSQPSHSVAIAHYPAPNVKRHFGFPSQPHLPSQSSNTSTTIPPNNARTQRKWSQRTTAHTALDSFRFTTAARPYAQDKFLRKEWPSP